MTKRTEWPTEPRSSHPDEWRDDASCEDLRQRLLVFKDDPFCMEAQHIAYAQFFGESYTRSDFAADVRRRIFEATGRAVQ